MRGNAYAARKLSSGELLEAWADRGQYLFESQTGHAESDGKIPVRFRRTSSSGTVLDGWSERAIWKGPEKALLLEGAVRLNGSSETARSHTALYSLPEKSLYLTGGPPVLKYKTQDFLGSVQAEAIHLRPDEGRLTATGRAHGWVHFLK